MPPSDPSSQNGSFPAPPTASSYLRMPSTRASVPRHLCIYEPRDLPCNPCKWWNLGTCNKARCKFCHIPPMMPTSSAPKRQEWTAEQEDVTLREMLPEQKLQGFVFYHDKLVPSLVGNPALQVLQQDLRTAYIESFSISSSKPYGAFGEFNPAIRKAKQLIDDIEQFANYSKYKDPGRSDEEAAQSRTTRLNAQIWQEPKGKKLHKQLLKKISEAQSRDAILAWLNITKDATQVMVGLKAATRGAGGDMKIEEDDDLHQLQDDLSGMVADAASPEDCRGKFRHEFGEVF